MSSEGTTSKETEPRESPGAPAVLSPHFPTPRSSSWASRRDPGQPFWQVAFYRLSYWLLRAFFVLVYRVRFIGTDNVPDAGGVLVIANHQSHLDPPLVGVGFFRRNMAAIAREGLFRVPVLGWWLRGVGCISIKEEGGDAAAMRVGIEQLKRGRLILIFPEGSRSPDGTIQPFKRGVWVLMMRAGVPVVPAAVEGCFDAWPRQQKLPSLFGHRVAVAYGPAIPFAELKAMGSEAGLARLQGEVERLRAGLAETLARK